MTNSPCIITQALTELRVRLERKRIRLRQTIDRTKVDLSRFGNRHRTIDLHKALEGATAELCIVVDRLNQVDAALADLEVRS